MIFFVDANITNSKLEDAAINPICFDIHSRGDFYQMKMTQIITTHKNNPENISWLHVRSFKYNNFCCSEFFNDFD